MANVRIRDLPDGAPSATDRIAIDGATTRSTEIGSKVAALIQELADALIIADVAGLQTALNALMPKVGGVFTGGVTFQSGMILPTAAGTNEFKGGNADGASYADHNFILKGWWGMGMARYDNVVTGFYDFRSGIWDVKGGYRVDGQAVWHAGTLNPSDYMPKAGGNFTGGVTFNAAYTAFSAASGSVTGLDIGKNGAPHFAFFDFHTGTASVDFDSRIAASGAVGVDAKITFTSDAFEFNARPLFAGSTPLDTGNDPPADGQQYARRNNAWVLASGGAGGSFPTGTAMLFAQTAAPTGWTKSTTHNDKALRVVSGTASTGGTVAFSTVFARTATDGYQLVAGDMPLTTEAVRNDALSVTVSKPSGGAGTAHTHNIDLRVQYVDVIIATKD